MTEANEEKVESRQAETTKAEEALKKESVSYIITEATTSKKYLEG